MLLASHFRLVHLCTGVVFEAVSPISLDWLETPCAVEIVVNSPCFCLNGGIAELPTTPGSQLSLCTAIFLLELKENIFLAQVFVCINHLA